MITKVSTKRGNRVRGLVEYLFGPGKSDEHTNPRVVAAYDDVLVGDRGDTELGRGMLAAELDYPRRAFAPEITDKFVYHVSISNPVEDGVLSDEQWRDVADTAAEKLGFNDGGVGAGVRWIAVHHGASVKGNDHIHLVANLVKEDGRKHWFPRRDFPALQELREEMETKYGLVRRTAPSKAGTPALSRVEVTHQRATRQESPRELMARRVRAAATAASSEAEFVATVRREGVIVRPRWASGGRSAVVGYSVALPTATTGATTMVWFGGGKLGGDLTLPALRAGWEAESAAGPQAGAGLAAWRTADARTSVSGGHGAGRPIAAPGPDTPVVADRVQLEAAARTIAAVRARLAEVEVGDTTAWSAYARDGAGVLAAAAEGLAGREQVPVAQAAHALARAAWREPRRHIGRPDDGGGLAAAAKVLLAVQAARSETFGTAFVLTELFGLVQTIHDQHVLAGRIVQAQHTAEAAERNLAALHRVGGSRELPAEQEPGAEHPASHRRRTVAELVEAGSGPLNGSDENLRAGLAPGGQQAPRRTSKDTEQERDR